MAVADVVELQDEVERILRRLSLDETKGIAAHLQIEDIPETDTKRDVLRRIQDVFDGAADDETRNTLLRGLPIPEAQRDNYERVFVPQIDQVVPQVDPVQNIGEDAPNQGNLDQNALQNGEGLFGLQQQNVGALFAGNANAGAVNAGGGANFGGLPAGGANFAMANAMPNAMSNAGPGVVSSAGAASAGGYNLGVVAQNRLLHAHGGGFVQNPMYAGARNTFVSGGLAQSVPGSASANAVGAQNFLAQNVPGSAPANVVGGQNFSNTGPVRPRGVPQNAGRRGPAPNNVPGMAQNMWNTAQPQMLHNLGFGPQVGLNMQGMGQFPQYPQQRFVQMFPREFRMTGSICDDISKSMTYLDICRQVSDGRRKGYSDDEILSGMRRVMTTGAVKTYVDSQVNQPLEDILLFLRSFLKTETPSELNNRLSQLAQKEDQAAIAFFMQALEIRQLIVVGSQVEGNVSHDPKLVHSTFLHTIRTGLRDESVRSHMLPFLSEANPVDDNSLIRELHKAVSESEERRKKTEKSVEKKSSVKVSVVESSPELAALVKMVQENQTQMKAMQEQMGELLKSNPAVKKFNRKPGCEACAAADKSSSCKHCWKCGQDGHKANEPDKCPKSN